MFCIVSWHHEGRDLGFWDGHAFGTSENAVFFETRRRSAIALGKVKEPAGPGFLKPNVLDVEAFNAKFGKSIGPKPKVQMTVGLDSKTGILERVETRG